MRSDASSHIHTFHTQIRTPLNAVSGAAALLARTGLDGEQRELVALLEAGTAHVVLIVEDILIAGALASGAFAVARERLALGAAVLDPAWRMVAMQRSQQAKLRCMALRRRVAEGVPAEIVGDSTRLTQVLTNILSNSIKFTPEGGEIQLDVDVTDEAPAGVAVPPPAEATEADVAAVAATEQQREERQRWLRFRVTDTGIGVDAGAPAASLLHVRACMCACAHLTAPSCCPVSFQRTSSAFLRPLCRRSSPPCAATAARGWASRHVTVSSMLAC
jgi:signal transduction histidine kinase